MSFNLTSFYREVFTTYSYSGYSPDRMSHEQLVRKMIEGFYEYDKTKLPYEYVDTSYRCTLWDPDNNLAGGVLFQSKSDKFRTRKLYKFTAEPYMLEMNGLWLSHDVPELVRLAFWCYVVQYLSGSFRECRVVFSYDVKKSSLAEFYKWIAPETLYEGNVPGIEGMPGDSVERICVGSVALFEKLITPFIVQRLKKALSR